MKPFPMKTPSLPMSKVNWTAMHPNPKIKLPKGRMGEVRIVPQARKGRAPHPQKPEHILVEKMNKKEMQKALRSAIAATAVKSLAEKRSHVLNGIKELPIIVDDSFESLKKTKEVRDALNKLGLEQELERASEIKIRAGRGKSRGRRYKRKRSVLLVTGKEGVLHAAENITGVDVRAWNRLDADVLAPGGVPGRVTIYTESALKAMEKM
jgi:large subunit ribosomal protein L4e